MATLKERSDNWNARGIIKRDFQHDHSGPEEIPHKKKGTGKKYCKKNKGPHVYEEWTDWSSYGSYRYRYSCCKCGKRRFDGYWSQRLVTSTIFVGGEEKTYTRWV
jgi:hypothetical protein